MTDLERQVGQVWSADVRKLVYEAMSCYNAGAVRAAITTTWTAVIADIIEKILELADGGDADAQKFQTTVEQARTLDIQKPGVQAMQKVEDGLLDDAQCFELIDSITACELERIREDRNLCVHPPLRRHGEGFRTSARSCAGTSDGRALSPFSPPAGSGPPGHRGLHHLLEPRDLHCV